MVGYIDLAKGTWEGRGTKSFDLFHVMFLTEGKSVALSESLTEVCLTNIYSQQLLAVWFVVLPKGT